MEASLNGRPTLEERLVTCENGYPYRWFESPRSLINRLTGAAWYPDFDSPPSWVPDFLAVAWFVEEALTASPAPEMVEPAFDEPEGECRKSAESASKPRLELVPFDVIEEIAEALTYGASKYEANNWTRGARWGRYFAAMLRHGFAWWRGEDRDPETGFSHLAHLGCNLIFLMSYQRHGWGEDDRFRGPDSKAFIKHDGAT
jgi:hypothetical protein